MAGVNIESSGRGRRGVDAHVNMVPMIDLLVSTIAFLLMTAVWTQQGSLAAHQPSAPPSDVSRVPATLDPELKITISPTGFRIGRTAADVRDLACTDDCLAVLRTELDARRRAEPGVREVVIQPDSTVSFEQIARVMDVVNAAWMPARGGSFRDAVTIRLS